MKHTKATHTKGPWKVQSVHSQYFVNKEVKDGHRGICSLAKENGESQANAQLISAAPELLDALKFARSFLNSKDPAHFEQITRIDDAISKAEGK